MTRARGKVLLLTAWVGTNVLLISVAGVPPWLALIGNVAGAAVIGNYVRGLPEAPLSRSDRIVRGGAFVVLGTVAAVFALLLVLTMLAFLVAWLAN